MRSFNFEKKNNTFIYVDLLYQTSRWEKLPVVPKLSWTLESPGVVLIFNKAPGIADAPNVGQHSENQKYNEL